MNLRYCKKEAGFTLIEVLIATFILAVGISAVIGMFITSIKANTLGRNTTIGNRIAQNLMEQVKTQTFNEAGNNMCAPGSKIALASCVTEHTTSFEPDDTTTRKGIYQESTVGDMNAFQYNVSMQQIENRPLPGLNLITVSVDWIDQYGKHETRFITYQEE